MSYSHELMFTKLKIPSGTYAMTKICLETPPTLQMIKTFTEIQHIQSSLKPVPFIVYSQLTCQLPELSSYHTTATTINGLLFPERVVYNPRIRTQRKKKSQQNITNRQSILNRMIQCQPAHLAQSIRSNMVPAVLYMTVIHR